MPKRILIVVGVAGGASCAARARREPAEFSAGHIEGAFNIPLPQMRDQRPESAGRVQDVWSFSFETDGRCR
jgi:hypothetical protein